MQRLWFLVSRVLSDVRIFRLVQSLTVNSLNCGNYLRFYYLPIYFQAVDNASAQRSGVYLLALLVPICMHCPLPDKTYDSLKLKQQSSPYLPVRHSARLVTTSHTSCSAHASSPSAPDSSTRSMNPSAPADPLVTYYSPASPRVW